MTTIDTLTPAGVAAIRALYDAGVSTAEICARFAMSRTRFDALRKAQGWPPRGTPARHRARRQPFSPDMMIARLEAAITLLVARIETKLKNPDATNAQQDLQMLAGLGEARVEFERLKEADAPGAPHPPKRVVETRH